VRAMCFMTSGCHRGGIERSVVEEDDVRDLAGVAISMVVLFLCKGLGRGKMKRQWG
jgi:hypothetical protein